MDVSEYSVQISPYFFSDFLSFTDKPETKRNWLDIETTKLRT